MPAAPPVPPCPDTPNCERTQRAFEASPNRLYQAAQAALADLNPVSCTTDPNDRSAQAVYRVALVFKDDVHIAVRPGKNGGSVLHIRSASRVGYSDLGVNERRVRRFFRALAHHF
ncbi:DUF1499 domain-containing protein [Longimonas halophila]|uniref:DUF1499 domain-containing protein n=1 Tax=Longimonas halophila TaxID=1469170 RepID=UPI00159670A4|nr:DUF1499 domain-containing protein [Longimonas halophila]